LSDGAALLDALWFSAFWETSCDRSPWPLIERARSLPPTGKSGGWPMHPEPREVLARAFLRDGRIDEARSLVEEGFGEVGDDGPMYTRHGQSRLLVSVELAAGRFLAAESISDEWRGEAEQTGNTPSACEGLLHGATAASLLGEDELARTQASKARELGQ